MIGMMFVTGMTSLVSMVALAIVMVAMKVSGQGVRLASVFAVALVLAGVAVGMQWMPLGSHHHH